MGSPAHIGVAYHFHPNGLHQFQFGCMSAQEWPEEWLREILRHHDIQVAQVGLEIALSAAQLPFIHRDPCDRLIVATARRHNCPVVTADPHVAPYGVDVIW